MSNWLTVLPITEFGFELSKQQFWDSDIVGKTCNLPPSCPCGSDFNIKRSMSCKKGGFTYIQLNDLRDLTADMMSEVYKDTEIEHKLKLLSGKEVQGTTSNNINKARIDIRTRSFQERG